MRPFRLVPLAAIAVLAAACSSGGASPAWSFAAAPAPTAAATSTAAPTAAAMSTPAPTAATALAATPGASSDVAAATRIDVTLTDALKIEPAAMTVPAGQPVTFVVTNTGTTLHEFTLGDEAEQMAHDKEMMEAGGMSMPKDEPMAIGVEPGQTKQLTVTFDKPGAMLAGCHVVGHYAAGMKASITIQ